MTTQYDQKGILKPRFLSNTRAVPRPEDYLENPYKGRDGKEYHNLHDLERANQGYNNQMSAFMAVSFLVGTVTGAASMYLAADYVGKKAEREAQAFELERTCRQAIQPTWEQFEVRCDQKSVDRLADQSLDPLLEQRDTILKEHKCPDSVKEETWNCNYNASENKFIAKRK